jgi:hypothetical protein
MVVGTPLASTEPRSVLLFTSVILELKLNVPGPIFTVCPLGQAASCVAMFAGVTCAPVSVVNTVARAGMPPTTPA